MSHTLRDLVNRLTFVNHTCCITMSKFMLCYFAYMCFITSISFMSIYCSRCYKLILIVCTLGVSSSRLPRQRYFIPWYDLRKVSVDNLNQYQTFQISNADYKVTRVERVEFLKSIGLDPKVLSSYIPEDYQKILDFIWLSVIRNLLKKLEKSEDILESYGFTNFAISGHTEGNQFAPWQMFDKSRYTLVNKNVKM